MRTLIAVLALAAAAGASAQPIKARLAVTQDAAGPRIEPGVYGHFVEHAGTGVYGGLWVGPDSKIPNTRGWRNDVLQALKRVGVPVMRWPGGCFADDYDWRDGIGAPAQRPARRNRWWGGVETNRVGTHEFMDFAEQLGSEVYLSGNMGSMPPRAMAQWLDYMTADDSSALAQERRRNGRNKPWKVKYFGVGNESFGCGGHMRSEYQADLHNQYATFLKDVTRVASGDGEGDDHRVEVLMQRSARQMEALTLHYYALPDNWTQHGDATGFDAGAWARTLKSALGIVATNLTGTAQGQVLTAAAMDAHNTFQQPQAVVPARSRPSPARRGAGAGAVTQVRRRCRDVGPRTEPRLSITLVSGGDNRPSTFS